MDSTLPVGWDGMAELQQLQLETTRLLASLDDGGNAAARNKGFQHGALPSKDLGGTRKGSRRRKGSSSSKNVSNGTTLRKRPSSSSLPMRAELPPMLGATSPLRRTVALEGLDKEADGSPRHHEGRDAFSTPTKRPQVLDEDFEADEKLGKLDFKDEESRTRLGMDTFVPSPSTTLEELKMERERLAGIEEGQRAVRLELKRVEMTRKARRKWLKKDDAALGLQRLWRGHVGRRRAAILYHTAELLRAASSDWIEVRDTEAGEVWYYNPTTGESQWTRPESLLGKVGGGEGGARRLPPVSKVQQQQHQQAHQSDPISENRVPNHAEPTVAALPPLRSRRQTLLNEDAFGSESCESGRNSDLGDGNLGPEETDDEVNESDAKQLFLSDGSPNIALREAVSKALRSHKFDSVSALLADYTSRIPRGRRGARTGRGAENDPFTNAFTGGSPPRTLFSKPTQRRMVSVMRTRPRGRHPQLAQKSLSPVPKRTTLAVRQIPHPGFTPRGGPGEEETPPAAGKTEDPSAEGQEKSHKPSQVCFACWSAARGKSCAMHSEKTATLRPSESALVCRNWDLGALRRKRRAEELHEVFNMSSSSLRFDRKRGKFSTVTQPHHPIYRAITERLERCNFTLHRRLRQANWFRGFLESLRIGRVGRSEQTKILQWRSTMANNALLSSFKKEAVAFRPAAPSTGSTLPERRGMIVVLSKVQVRGDSGVRHIDCVLDGPTPVPVSLYEPRKYLPPPPRTDAILDPPPGLEEQKDDPSHPTPVMKKFATLTRKRAPGDLALGGLCPEMIICALVETTIRPLYGSLTVMHKASIAPNISPEQGGPAFAAIEIPATLQVYISRPLQHALNSRKGPSVGIKTLIGQDEKFYYGKNRPAETGEELYHGFRTSASATPVPVTDKLDPQTFTPSEDIAAPNLASANRTHVTHADKSYPFCVPSNRANTMLDFYHLLLTGEATANQEQTFASLGVQECGEFMRESDVTRPMGHCISIVYRSWAFLQRQEVEEFATDDGIPYWFNRRTGDTFWERPLCKEETVPIKKGGTKLDGAGEAPDNSNPSIEGVQPRYDQAQMRRLVSKRHESLEEIAKRRKMVAASTKWAVAEGILQPPHDVNVEVDGGYDTSSNVFQQKEDGKALPSREGRAEVKESAQQRSDDSPVHQSKSRSERGNSAAGEPIKATTLPVRSSGQAAAISSQTNVLMEKIAAGIAASGISASASGESMLRLGMGLGLSLQAAGLLDVELQQNGSAERSASPAGRPLSSADSKCREEDVSKVMESQAQPYGNHPIGHGHLKPNVGREDSDHLPRLSTPPLEPPATLTGQDIIKDVFIVPEPTLPPDEDGTMGGKTAAELEVDPRTKVALENPVMAFPKDMWKKEYVSHSVAGRGESWETAGDVTEIQSSKGVKVTRCMEGLPAGFLSSISKPHVGGQHVDYLPHVPNLPQARPVGRIKARSAAEDWLAVGFDPWSAGREPLSAEFIPTLMVTADDLTEEGSSAGLRATAGGNTNSAYIESRDEAGAAEHALVTTQENKMATDFEMLCSWARHERYQDVETTMNQGDWIMPIDYQNNQGCTLLHIAAQNGNKRIAKLALRKGANVNKQNYNGQTPLHYACAYGFSALSEYLMSKGADDSILNADGLTCYEGLSAEELNKM